MNITKKDCTSGIGLILMFALGWIANGLVDKLTCDNNNDPRRIERMEKDLNERLQQRLNRMDSDRYYNQKRMEMERWGDKGKTQTPNRNRKQREPQI